MTVLNFMVLLLGVSVISADGKENTDCSVHS